LTIEYQSIAAPFASFQGKRWLRVCSKGGRIIPYMYRRDAAGAPVCCGGAITGFAASPGNTRHLPDRRLVGIG